MDSQNNAARSEEELATQRRARLLALDYADTSKMVNPPLYKDILSVDELTQLKLVPLQADKFNILFGITNTTSQSTMSAIRQRFSDQQTRFALISEAGWRDYMKLYNPPKTIVYQDVAIAASGATSNLADVSATLNQVRADDMLAYLVKQAHRLKSSDIHLENQKDNVRIRFRVDGVLHPVAELSKDKYRQMLSSVAIAANITSGSSEVQTGHISQTYTLQDGEEVAVNLRVETVPAIYGQDIVMRLFNFNAEFLKLDNLGLAKNERDAIDEIIKHPSGMVLIVGPTGSGKTTTMYSILNSLNTPERKIITLEDPVEYYLKGVVQIPVKGKDASGFAEKLRAVLRLDPDVVMIGEIRDQDTARTALQAALTGHLVLSTFHASNASAALTRMMDAIGINPLFASAIRMVMAQRLVRRLDDNTKQEYQPDADMLASLKLVISSLPKTVKKPDINSLKLYRPMPSVANPFGFKGQVALREQLPMTSAIQTILRMPPNEVSTELIEKKAAEEGMLTMLQDGVLKAVAGQTTIEEVYRVVG